MKALFVAWGIAALTQAAAAPAGPLDLPAVGRCVWDKLADTQRAAFVGAAEPQSLAAMAAALNALSSREWFNLIDQCDERATAHGNVLAVVSAAMVQEGDAVLIQRSLGLAREKLDAAIAAAPSESKAALETVVREKRAGRSGAPGAATTAATPIARALGIPDVEKFMTTAQGQRLVAYCLDYFQTRIAAAEGAPR